jgi:uracil phosphoribosyltransferase
VDKTKTLHIVDHPLMKHKLAHLRDEKTDSKLFRELVNEISIILGIEASRDLPVNRVKVQTPLTQADAQIISMNQIVILPILRAGLGMVDGLLTLFPKAKVGHLGLERDHVTHLPSEYYFKLPPHSENSICFVVDPMLATGGSVISSIEKLKDMGIKNIRFICLIAAPEGVEVLCRSHPDVDIFIGALDEKLDVNKYIIPGLGDAGDRLYGTE